MHGEGLKVVRSRFVYSICCIVSVKCASCNLSYPRDLRSPWPHHHHHHVTNQAIASMPSTPRPTRAEGRVPWPHQGTVLLFHCSLTQMVAPSQASRLDTAGSSLTLISPCFCITWVLCTARCNGTRWSQVSCMHAMGSLHGPTLQTRAMPAASEQDPSLSASTSPTRTTEGLQEARVYGLCIFRLLLQRGAESSLFAFVRTPALVTAQTHNTPNTRQQGVNMANLASS
jgi:hypothetical protein